MTFDTHKKSKMTISEPLPNDWDLKSISELGKIYSGATPSTSIKAYWNGDIVWITPNDLSNLNTRLIHSSERKITDQGLKNCSANLLPAKSLVISSRAPIGYLALPTTDFCTNQGCKSIVFDDGQEPNFHYYNFAFRIRQIREKGEGTTFAEISKTALAQIKFPVPEDKRTQAKIAEVLTAVDQSITQTEALIAKYQRIKTGLMQDLLTRGIDENGNLRDPATHEFKDSPLGSIPNEWDCVKSETLCRDICVGIVIKPSQYYQESGVPTLRSANIHESGINSDNFVFISEESNRMLSKSMVREGYVLSVRTGYPGTTAVVPPHLDGANCIDLVISKPGNEVLPYFLSMWINSPFGKDQVLRGQGGLAQQHFNVKEMRNLLVFKPSIEEQQRIIDAITAQNNLLETEQSHLEKLNLIKNGLMQDLLTGKVSVEPLLAGKEGK